MNYADRLTESVRRAGNPCLVGLDPHEASLPEEFAVVRDPNAPRAAKAKACADFLCAILEVCAGKVPAVKPQSAFFEIYGADGALAWERVVSTAKRAGLIVIGLVGLIVIAAGIYRIMKGVRVEVADELTLSSLTPRRRRMIERLGAVGEIGRGIGVGLVGFFLLRAAVTYNADEATGLDGALRRMVLEPWGIAVVLVVGVGFAAYGLFCVATFTHRELRAP